MDIQVRCCCKWPLSKQSRIMALIKTRAGILLGETIVGKVDKLVFTDANSISIFPNGSEIVYIKDFAFLQKCTNNTFTLLINSSILFGMLRPGIGQANFDEIMLSTKAAIRDL